MELQNIFNVQGFLNFQKFNRFEISALCVLNHIKLNLSCNNRFSLHPTDFKQTSKIIHGIKHQRICSIFDKYTERILNENFDLKKGLSFSCLAKKSETRTCGFCIFRQNRIFAAELVLDVAFVGVFWMDSLEIRDEKIFFRKYVSLSREKADLGYLNAYKTFK